MSAEDNNNNNDTIVIDSVCPTNILESLAARDSRSFIPIPQDESRGFFGRNNRLDDLEKRIQRLEEYLDVMIELAGQLKQADEEDGASTRDLSESDQIRQNLEKMFDEHWDKHATGGPTGVFFNQLKKMQKRMMVQLLMTGLDMVKPMIESARVEFLGHRLTLNLRPAPSSDQ